ncbi:hypothetical protein PG997_012649 [Apiospora hydei]|uniref:Uncharacterized protein n=1 Tax=Apiospora hydei TaxID=1337664 RepID=A0ABR1V4R3_9PEZI
MEDAVVLPEVLEACDLLVEVLERAVVLEVHTAETLLVQLLHADLDVGALALESLELGLGTGFLLLESSVSLSASVSLQSTSSKPGVSIRWDGHVGPKDATPGSPAPAACTTGGRGQYEPTR